jgi:hypothetical protein
MVPSYSGGRSEGLVSKDINIPYILITPQKLHPNPIFSELRISVYKFGRVKKFRPQPCSLLQAALLPATVKGGESSVSDLGLTYLSLFSALSWGDKMSKEEVECLGASLLKWYLRSF